MKVKLVSYLKRKNLGNYEHEQIRLVAELEKGDTVSETISFLKEEAEKHLGQSVETVNSDFETKKAHTTESPKSEMVAEQDVAKPKKASKKSPKNKNVPYSRDITLHTDLVKGLFTKHFPNWRKDLLVQAKQASIDLVGTDLLDEEGNVLESFEKILVEKMNSATE
jgi:DNA-binding protein H-NS